ncbi:MAG TPA: protocatechuate 3,4-dioxygenase subunit alpha [Chloroflexi bacterium]|nr:protocatechuate 3,4-dioxygenase subunit alpha [Chloroflexota bacterium]HAF20956.1 protocatechuate 3,4-dioxygenase subunit alpha [Chloroflexota bacterium]
MSEHRIPTPSQTVGPFFGYALPFEDGDDAVSGHEAMRIEGQLLDGAGEPVPDGLVELWGGQQFKRCRTDSEGVFHFTVVKPAAGVEAPHLDVTIFARGLLRHLATRMYFPDEETANASDRVLNLIDPARRHTLIAHRDDAVLRFDIRLQGESETVFFAL